MKKYWVTLVERVRRQFVEEGLPAALERRVSRRIMGENWTPFGVKPCRD